MYTTTLKQLRQSGACFGGYNKLVRYLQNLPFTEEDEGRESYIRFKHDEAIPVSVIVKSNGITDACWTLDKVVESENFHSTIILYAVACARDVQHILKDQRSYAALDVAEKYAKGEATYEELTEAVVAARAARAAEEAWAARIVETAAEVARSAALAAAWAAETAARAARAAGAAGAAVRVAAEVAGEDVEKLKEKQIQHLIQICNAGCYVAYVKESS